MNTPTPRRIQIDNPSPGVFSLRRAGRYVGTVAKLSTGYQATAQGNRRGGCRGCLPSLTAAARWAFRFSR